MAGFINKLSEVADAKHARKMDTLKNKGEYLGKKGEYLTKKGEYLTKKGAYKKMKAEAANSVTEPRLQYKIKKRSLIAASAAAADAETTARKQMNEDTRRTEIQANKDVQLTRWSNITGGNPSIDGQEGTSQNGSITSIRGNDRPTTIITSAGYRV